MGSLSGKSTRVGAVSDSGVRRVRGAAALAFLLSLQNTRIFGGEGETLWGRDVRALNPPSASTQALATLALASPECVDLNIAPAVIRVICAPSAPSPVPPQQSWLC